MRKNQEYIAYQIARQMCEDLGFSGGESLSEIQEHFIRTGFEERNDAIVEVAAPLGWLETRQAYRFSREIMEELLTHPVMDFRLRDLNLPFLSVYLDTSQGNFEVDGKKLMGAYVRVCLPPEEVVCVDSVLMDGNVCRLMKMSMSYMENQTLTEMIRSVTGDYEGDFRATELVCLLLAYISSEKPDVKDSGTKRYVHAGRTGKRPASHKEWEVGYRYIKERASQPKEGVSFSSHQSPRPHIRRGHWHTYRCGPGRKRVKVLWVSETTVGEGGIVDVIRIKE